MPLKQSVYDGGKRSSHCAICGASLPYSRNLRLIKCHQCAKKIAKDVEEEFRENRGHYLTEAILATGAEPILELFNKIEIEEITVKPEKPDEEKE